MNLLNNKQEFGANLLLEVVVMRGDQVLGQRNAKRKRGRMVRRRRRKKNITASSGTAPDDIFERDGGHETPVVPEVTDKVYFTPL